MADGVVDPGKRVWSKQRQPEKGKDGMSKVGCDHNEDPNLKGSLKKVSTFLDEADSLEMRTLKRESVRV